MDKFGQAHSKEWVVLFRARVFLTSLVNQREEFFK